MTDVTKTKPSNNQTQEENASFSLFTLFKVAAILRGIPAALFADGIAFLFERNAYKCMIRSLEKGRELYDWQYWSLGEAVTRVLIWGGLAFLIATVFRMVQLAVFSPKAASNSSSNTGVDTSVDLSDFD